MQCIYIWVIDNFIAYQGASYIRDFTVSKEIAIFINTICRCSVAVFTVLLDIYFLSNGFIIVCYSNFNHFYRANMCTSNGSTIKWKTLCLVFSILFFTSMTEQLAALIGILPLICHPVIEAVSMEEQLGFPTLKYDQIAHKMGACLFRL